MRERERGREKKREPIRQSGGGRNKPVMFRALLTTLEVGGTTHYSCEGGRIARRPSRARRDLSKALGGDEDEWRASAAETSRRGSAVG